VVSIDVKPGELGAVLERELDSWTPVIARGGVRAD
jgi:hypothetical protein